MDLIEVERKRILKADQLPVIINRLLELQYFQTGELHEIDTYYSRRDIDYMETVECLRVRERNGFAEITYKPATTKQTSSDDGIIAKKELNALLANSDQAIIANELLETIGLTKLVAVNKNRRSFSNTEKDNVMILIDTIIGAGVFIEIEIMSNDIESAKIILGEIEAEIGVSDCDIVTLPYRDIVMKNKQSNKDN